VRVHSALQDKGAAMTATRALALAALAVAFLVAVPPGPSLADAKRLTREYSFHASTQLLSCEAPQTKLSAPFIPFALLLARLKPGDPMVSAHFPAPAEPLSRPKAQADPSLSPQYSSELLAEPELHTTSATGRPCQRAPIGRVLVTQMVASESF